MKRILVIGSCGAGKSTFAKKLHKISGINIIHLDQQYWKPNWTRTDSDEWQEKVARLLETEEWIMDGNYRSTMDLRLPKADTVMWLDFPRFVCFWRILKRRWKKNRVDELDNCRERISFELLRWVLWKFPRDNKKDIEKRLKELKDKNIVVLKNNKDVETFFKNYESTKN